jgi:hypothetical protein
MEGERVKFRETHCKETFVQYFISLKETFVQYFISLGKEDYREQMFKIVTRCDKCLNVNGD